MFRRNTPAFGAAGPRAVPVVVLVVASFVSLAACGSDERQRLGLGPVGRTTTTAAPEPAELPLVTSLQPCDEVPLLEPGDDREPSIAVGLDQSVMAGLSEYGTANPDSFGGLWLDGRYGASPVLAMTGDLDDHRLALTGVVPDQQGLAPYILVPARYSQGALRQVADRLLADPGADVDSLWSAEVDVTRNRVVVGLLGPTDDELEVLGDAVRLDQVCTEITPGPAIGDGPLDVLPGSAGDRLLSCGGPSFPESALDRRLEVVDSDHPAARKLVTLVGGTEAAEGWIVLDDTGDRVLFGRYRGGGLEVDTTAEASLVAGGWEVAGWVFGCELRIGLPRGLGSVQIFLDPARPPSAGDRTVRVLVAELACAGGRDMGNRLLGPQVEMTASQVRLAFAVIALPESDGTCPDNPLTSVTIRLDEPLGARRLVDGLHLPPRPLTGAP